MKIDEDIVRILVEVLENPGPVVRALDDVLSHLRLSETAKYSDTAKTFLIGFDILKWFGVAAALKIVGLVEKVPRGLLKLGIGICFFLGTWDATTAIGLSDGAIPVCSALVGALAYFMSLRSKVSLTARNDENT